MTLKGLIFDFDGLMLDTETPEYQALDEVYQEHGQHLPVEMYGRVVGSQYNHEFEPVAHLEGLTGKQLDKQAFWQKVDRRRLEIINASELLPGVEAYLQQARARGLKLAVASSSTHDWVEGHLRRRDVLDYFEVIKCKEDVCQIKPAPDLFLAALDALQLSAEEALVFEDSLHGVMAAQRAGIRVVAVPNLVTENLPIEGESLRLKSLADLPFKSLLEQFSASGQ